MCGVKGKIDIDGADDMKFPGFSVGYLRGIGLTQKVPLYLEVGGEIDFNRYSESEEGEDYKQTILGLKIPVSLVYRLNINENFSISPLFGFDFRLNLMGKGKLGNLKIGTCSTTMKWVAKLTSVSKPAGTLV